MPSSQQRYIHSIRQYLFLSRSFSTSPRIPSFSLYLFLQTHSYAHFLNTLFERVSFFSIFFAVLRFAHFYSVRIPLFLFLEFLLFWFRRPCLWWGLWEGKKEGQCGFHVVVVFLFFWWTIRLQGFLDFFHFLFFWHIFCMLIFMTPFVRCDFQIMEIK